MEIGAYEQQDIPSGICTEDEDDGAFQNDPACRKANNRQKRGPGD